MPTVSLSWPGGPLTGTGHLPASKSESNRALLLQHLAGGGTLTNLSEAHDTVLMQRLLRAADITDHLDAEDAGTVMRFMAAYLAASNWEGTLTGTARMQQRPIAVLVDALREVGAAIHYAGQEGYPPLRFGGSRMPKRRLIEMRGDVSSQYISAMLMVAPFMPGALRLHLTGKISSRPYLDMTLGLMQHFGITAAWTATYAINVRGGGYYPADYTIENDWSAASYWYALVALAPANSYVTLPGLRATSWQGDHIIREIMRPLGIETLFRPDAMNLLKVPARPADLLAQPLDFTDCPDLAQTVAVVAAAQGLPLRLTGLASLRIKETDRIAALQTELRKFGADMPEVAPGVFEVQADKFEVSGQTVATYHDHRMALAFAPLAMRGPLRIEDPAVVRKSYPSFWQALAEVGMLVTTH